MLYYGLYHCKERHIIEIVTNPNLLLSNDFDNTVKLHNDNYFYSLDRNKIKEKAEEIKAMWVKDSYDKFDKYRKMKIKNKYNKPQK